MINERANTSKSGIIVIIYAMSLFSASILTLEVAGFKLSPYRLLILLYTFICVLEQRSRYFNAFDKKYVYFMLIWLIYGIISIGWVINISDWVTGIYFMFSAFALTYLSCSYINTRDAMVNCCKSFSLFVGIHNVIGYYEMLTRDYHWIQAGSTSYFLSSIRTPNAVPVSVFYNHNDYACVLVIGIVFSIIAFKFSKSKLTRALYMAIAISSLYQIVRTLSRGSMLAVIVIFAVYYALGIKKTRNMLITIALIVIGAVIFTFSGAGEIVSSFLDKYLNFSLENKSEIARLKLLENGFDTLVSTLGFGAGAGNLANANTLYGSYNLKGGSVHFWFAEVLFTYGIIIFVIYVTLYITLISKYMGFVRKASTTNEDRFICRIFVAYLIGFIIGSLSPSGILKIESVWCSWAIIIAYMGVLLGKTKDRTKLISSLDWGKGGYTKRQ